MKKVFFLIGSFLMVFLFLGLLACSKKTEKKTSSAEESHESEEVEILGDVHFQKGIGLQGTNPADPSIHQILRPFGGTGDPVWTLAQWNSKYDLEGVTAKNENGTVVYENEGKKISLKKGKGEINMSIEIFGSKEYDAPRQQTLVQDWPGLLLGQEVPTFVFLDEIKELKLNVEARLLYAENKMKPADYNPDIHTAQWTLYFNVQNRSQTSPDYGDYLWFGVPFYDFRYDDMEGHNMQDGDDEVAGGGTGKLIYTVNSKDLFDGHFNDGNWKKINLDIYPYVLEAFNFAQSKGYLSKSALRFMTISGTNLGWEIPGTFDAGIEFKGLSLKAVLK